jgi:hypothetical protein
MNLFCQCVHQCNRVGRKVKAVFHYYYKLNLLLQELTPPQPLEEGFVQEWKGQSQQRRRQLHAVFVEGTMVTILMVAQGAQAMVAVIMSCVATSLIV